MSTATPLPYSRVVLIPSAPPPKESIMPFANFKFPEGIVDAARKEEIIHRTTAMFVEYFGEQARPYSMVLVEEVADGGWGRADQTLTLAKMGKPPSKE
ncbi:tautomerase family protein [Paraburkholderia sp. SARCC-3016]|uniref:tautomerase family protein n=1 Tax=Paraburkholderia sp. SARCC-3016 TaxID=3058611 RepID=UPI002807C791|nr:tautomerase family protein [Paraburkholderia sp. SARCC-3016]MDQ7977957.1 tautomerase family protein [Paraburkholderia sp. SARCC-3016]